MKFRFNTPLAPLEGGTLHQEDPSFEGAQGGCSPAAGYLLSGLRTTRYHKRKRIKPAAVILAAMIACLLAASAGFASGRLPVFVSILPQKYFVDRIGGDRVEVSVMVAPGASPATYEPRPRQMVALGAAKLYFAVGVPFEAAWLDKISAVNPDMTIVHTEAGIEKMPMAAADPLGTDTEPVHQGHDHGVLDPHIWLSPPLVKTQATRILEALAAADPPFEPVYRANYLAFMRELDDLDAHLRQLFSDQKGREFMVFHPSWGYFALAYGLVQVPVEIEGKDPKPAQLQAIITRTRKRGIRVVFVQPQFSTRNAAMIARAIGGEVVVADPLAEDWADNLREQAEVFRRALR